MSCNALVYNRFDILGCEGRSAVTLKPGTHPVPALTNFPHMIELLKPCLSCSQPTTGTRCPEHRVTRKRKRGSATARGYDSRHARLSRRARELQPFCEDCGATTDLQADHSPEAWRRRAEGKAVRLCDISVVCGSCNRARGAARGDSVTRTE